MAKKTGTIVRRTVNVLNNERDAGTYAKYLEEHGMLNIKAEQIENGRRVQFSFDYEVPEPAVANPADVGVDDGNDFGDGGPTREDITGSNPNEPEPHTNADRAAAGLPAREAVNSDAALSGGDATTEAPADTDGAD